MNEQESSIDNPSKKRKRNDPEDGKVRKAPFSLAPKRLLSHQDYTVGWICALHVELTAARLMLDEEHLPLPIPSHDDNCYVLGQIGYHNIVIACLPAGVYGKSSAALVAKSMVSTFTNTDTFLMVGISGGVPSSNNDIRLGDVVIGVPTSETAAVIEYDLGKTGPDGFERKGSLDKPRASLLKAVTCLRSSHSLMPNRMTDSMVAALRKYSMAHDFNYPDATLDTLWEQDCEHSLNKTNCWCESMKPAIRQARSDTMPRIFYGAIGSGDQVIKDRHTRDDLARQHGILCFEMEAAGLMDSLHALVIRGICDYCDAKKSDEFQPYASLTAAAYAKELLSELPTRSTNAYDRANELSHEALKHRKEIMAALKFEVLDARRANVKMAHSQTCNWLLKEPEYLDWIDSNSHDSTLLWIKGKPGTGKSTIMKFLHDHITREKQKNDIIAAFFFYARGSELQKSILGLYQSLIFQLMDSAPDMQHLLDKLRLHIDGGFSLNPLVELFHELVNKLGSRRLTCCVDALDECPEDEAREMVETFEGLVRSAAHRQIHLRIVFSSRHYPNIVMIDAKTLILDTLPGHSNDIEKYIQAELRVGNNDQADNLRRQISRKSSGTFLWVVLVVSSLKKTYAKGRIHELGKRLAEIPRGLNELLYDILIRDTENIRDLLLCLQWVLYARRPLTCEELYSAMLISNDENQIRQHQEGITTEEMAAFILDASKGLVGFTQYVLQPEAQFIHESVREFLLTPGLLANLHCGFESFSAEASHLQLRDACYGQLDKITRSAGSYDPRPLPMLQEGRLKNIYMEFPLARYATSNVLLHAEYATRESQIPFMRNFNTEIWQGACSLVSTWYFSSFNEAEARWSLKPVADQDLMKIIARYIKREDINQCKAVFEAYYKSISATPMDLEHLDPLLEVIMDLSSAFVIPSVAFLDLFRLIVYWHHERHSADLNKAISVAMCCKREPAIRLLLARGVVCRNDDVLAIVSHWSVYSTYQSPNQSTFGNVSSWLKYKRHHVRHDEDKYSDGPPDTKLLQDTLKCVTFLFNQSSLMDLDGHQMTRILKQAIEWTNCLVVTALLDAFTKWPREKPSLEMALQWAVSCGKVQSVRLLLQRGVVPERAILHLALRPTIFQCLLHNNIDMELPDNQGNTALHLAVNRGADSVVMLLTSKGANPNARNHVGETPLHCAVKLQRSDIVVHLLRKGAHVDAVDKEGNTCLHVAACFACFGSTSNIKLLIHYGAPVEHANNHGRTPFQEIFNSANIIQPGMLLAAIALHNHGAKALLPLQKLKVSSVVLSSIVHTKLRESYEESGTCCQYAGLNKEQIYYQFYAPINSAHGLQTNYQDIDNTGQLILRRTSPQADPLGHLGLSVHS